MVTSLTIFVIINISIELIIFKSVYSEYSHLQKNISHIKTFTLFKPGCRASYSVKVMAKC